MVVEALLLVGVVESYSSFTVFRRLGIRNEFSDTFRVSYGKPIGSLCSKTISYVWDFK